MLVVACLGASPDCQGAIVNSLGAASDRQGAGADYRVPLLAMMVSPPTARLLPATVRVPPLPRCYDHGSHRSWHMDLHASPTVGANCHGL
jgi:hypothetical protein